VTNTLLVDGDNLFKIGFHGAKDLFNDGSHVGGVYHFINTLRRFLEVHNHDKVVVFWDGDSNSSARKKLYPQYKENRRRDEMNEYKYESYLTQKSRVKEYIEEVFVRQVEMHDNEADDLIAYYCKIAIDENIIIFSADKDLTQLINERVTIYSPVSKSYFKQGDKITINKVDIPHQNVLVCKVFTGDKSDNIDGIEGLGEKTLIKYFPELQEKSCTIEELLDNARNIPQTKPIKSLSNILTGKSKSGILGEEFYNMNKKIVDLLNPLITDEGKELVEQIHKDTIDPTDRGYKNLMRMMVKDGMFKFLPKNDEAWVDFLRPFMKLTRKEKRNTNKN
jgi:5'-3' exonuclease